MSFTCQTPWLFVAEVTDIVFGIVDNVSCKPILGDPFGLVTLPWIVIESRLDKGVNLIDPKLLKYYVTEGLDRLYYDEND